MLQLQPGDPHPTGGDLITMRAKAGLSLRALAARSGYSPTYLSRVENGLRTVTPELVRLYTTLSKPTTAPEQHVPLKQRPRIPGLPRVALPRPEAGSRTDPVLDIVWFGAEVRRLRMAQDKSLAALGSEIYVSRAYLGKIEQGKVRGNHQLALSLDDALGAGGRLTRLFLSEHGRVGPMPADVDILERPAQLERNSLHADPAGFATSAMERLNQLRVRSHLSGPHAVLAELSEGVTELHRCAAAHLPATARQLRSAALRYAEFLGWTAQETGHDTVALHWTLVARDWARMIGDNDAVGYALIRQSQLARRRGAPEHAVDLARAADALPGISPRIRQFAAQREAQACALANDEAGFRRALDRFHGLADTGRRSDPEADPVQPRWGPRPDPSFEQSRILEATCLIDLGDFYAAATLFAEHMSRLAADRTGYARLGIREAISYAQLGETELACEVTARWLPAVARAGSASLRGDLARLARTLNRHRTRPIVRDLLPYLSALASAAGAAPLSTAESAASPSGYGFLPAKVKLVS